MVTTNMSPFKPSKVHCGGVVVRLIIILFLINLITIEGAPTASTCSDGCSGSNQMSKYKFGGGTVYTYSLDSTVTVQLSGNDAQETSLKLQGNFQIFAQSNCNYVMKITKLFINGPDGKKLPNVGNDFIKPIRFQMTNDEINDICSETDDNEYSLNIKRSIISLFQADTTKRAETDIFGVCPTEFTESTSDIVKIGKKRNLNLCSHRETMFNGFIDGIVDKNSEIKSMPLLKGDYTSEMRIKNGILESVDLAEEYRYIPLSSANGGIRVKTATKITFLTSAAFTTQFPKIKKETKRSIIFTKPDNTQGTNIQNVRNVFKATVQAFENEISPKAASKFIELTRLFRFMKSSEFTQMYQQLKSGTLSENRVLARKIYLDALFRVGTGASVEACLVLLKNREFNDVEQKLLFLSFNIVKTMSKEAVTLITRYIDEGTLTTEGYLSFGHLIYKYCKQYSCDSNEIKSFYEKFGNKLGGCKMGTRAQEDTNLAILKGLRNTKYLFSPALEKVIQCTTDKVSTRLRVAALQALTAGSCNLKSQNTALNLMKNRNEDSEIRIEAYLVLASCPNGNVANEIKKMLDTETVYQVGSYIVSHLAGLRASVDPSKDAARYHFGQIRTSNKFPNDFRRYSFNRELSYDVSSMGMGASMESDVIYSQKSFMPRSARINMTGSVFGTSFNFFELEGRQENLDMVIEHYFGPKGLFKTSSPQELFDKLMESFKVVKEQTRQSIYGRRKRGVREDANIFAKSVTLGNDVNSDLDMDLSVKLFGNEMFFLSLGENMPSSPREYLDKFLECMRNSINEAKNFQHTYEKHAIFLDADLIYPTGAGLPLKLNAQGTGIFRLDTSTKVDIIEILKNPKNTAFDVKVEPSFNVEVSGTLSVDYNGFSTGLFVVGSLHSSTSSQIKFAMLNEGKGVDVSLLFPNNKQEIFNFDHRVVFLTQERGGEGIETPLKFSAKKREFKECFDQFFKLTGVTLCTDVSITLPNGASSTPFPLNGNNKLKVSLEVEPEYNLRAMLDDKNPKHRTLTLACEIKNGKMDRKATLKLEAQSEPNILLRATLESQIKNAVIEGGLTNNQNEISIYAMAKNDKDVYLAKLGFTKSGTESNEQFRPIITLNTPNSKDNSIMGYSVSGLINRIKFGDGKKFVFNNIKVESLGAEPFIINGYVTRVKSLVTTDLKLSRGSETGNIKGEFNTEPNNLLFDVSMISTFHKHANGRVHFELKHGERYMENNFLIVYGDDLNSQENRFELKQKYQYEENEENKQKTGLSFENQLNIPVITINLRLNGGFTEKSLNGDFDIVFGKAKNNLMIKLNGKKNEQTKHDYNIDVEGGYNGNKVNVNVIRVNKDGKIFLTNKITTNKGHTISINGDFNEKLTRENIDVNMNGNIVLPDGKQPDVQYSYQMKFFVTPKLINTNGKAMNGDTELASYTVNINRDVNNKNGKMEFIIKDVLNAKNDFKMVNGVGDGTLNIFMKKIGRRVKMLTKFTVVKPNYDINIDLFYDFDKDDKKKIHFDTKTTASNDLLNTNNNLEILNDKYSLNIDYEKKGELSDGKIKLNINLNLPTNNNNYYININTNIKRNENNKNLSGDSSFKIGYNINNYIKLTTIYNELYYDNHMINIENIIDYKYDDNTNIENDRITDGLIKFNINTIKQLNFLLNINEKFDINFSNKRENKSYNLYKILMKFDNHINIDINGKYNFNLHCDHDHDHHEHHDHSDHKEHNEHHEHKPILLIININYDKLNDKYELQFNNEFTYSNNNNINGKLIIKLINNNNNNIDFITNYNIKRKEKLFIDFLLNRLNKKTINGDITFTNNNQDNKQDNKPDNNPDNNYENKHDFNNNLIINFNYDDNKIYKLITNFETKNLRKIFIYNIIIKSPIKGFNDAEFLFNFNREVAGEYKTTMTLTSDNNNKYHFNNIIKLSRNNPLFSVDYTSPNRKLVKILFEHTNEDNEGRKFHGKILIENLRDLNLIANYDMNLSNINDLQIKIDADSKRLNLDKIIFEMYTKQKDNQKGIEFKGESGGKNVLSGYADYNIVQEKGKTIFEGTGTIKLNDKERAASFKFIRTIFEEAVHGETGVLYVLNGLIGQKNILGELKVTDKHFSIKNTICEEKKQCINIEIQSSLQRDNYNKFKHDLRILIDLREYGYAHEFGLKAATTQNGFVIDHTVDIHFNSNDKTKYQYSLYVQPEKFGIIIELPKRIIGIEGLYNYPKEHLYGIYDTKIIMYFDKNNKPNNKYIFSINGKINSKQLDNIKQKNVFTTNFEIKFENPMIKSYIININNNYNIINQKYDGEFIFDIFNNIDKRIILSYDYDNNINDLNNLLLKTKIAIYSRGLNINTELNTLMKVSYERKEINYEINFIPYNKLTSNMRLMITNNKFDGLIKILNDDLILINGNYDITKHNSNIKGQMKLLGCNPFIIEGQTKGLSSLTFKMSKDNLLNINGQLTASKDGTFKIMTNNKEVFIARIQFDQGNFLSSEYKIQDTDFKGLVKTLQENIKTDLETSGNILKVKFDELRKSSENQMKLIRTSFSDLTTIKNDLKTEMEAIKMELLNDPTIKEYVDFLIHIQTLIVESVHEMYKIVYDTFKRFQDTLTKTFDTYIQFYNDRIVPMYKDFVVKLEAGFKKIYNTLTNAIVDLLDKAIKFLKTFEEDYNKMNKLMLEHLKQLMSRVGKMCEAARKEIADLTKLIVDYVKTLSGFDIIKEKYNELLSGTAIGETVLSLLNEFVNSIKDMMPTKELVDFLGNLTEYLNKKIQNADNVNDLEQVTNLFYEFLGAIKSVYDLVRKTYQSDEFGTNFFTKFHQEHGTHPFLLPFSRFFAFNQFPLIANIRFSLLNYIRNEPIVTLRELLNVYRPYGFIPFNLIPPYTMHGQISDGSHIFTFDNSHYTFPGGCSYILAQDNFNNNFTILANMNNGKLRSITLIDKGDVVELSEQGVTQLNGKSIDLPIHKNDIHCWRKFHSIHLLTSYGAMIVCSLNLRVCHVTVSGYYLGRLRGLLGNGNSEPYDDFLLPNNKVADNFATFGNAYKLGKGDCKPVPFVDHSAHNHHTEVCSSLFNANSPLRYCYLFRSPTNYREACDHAVDTATDKQDAACNIALTYATTCHLDNIAVKLPTQCLKCKRNDVSLDIGNRAVVVTPSKEADIVFVVDIALDAIYMDMLQTTINEMRKELKTRDINDVNVIIIGYNKKHKYSYLLTTNGKLDFTGKLSLIKYTGPLIPDPIKTENKHLNDFFERTYKIGEQIKEDLSISADAKAFQLAMDYPFRATASRSIIAVRADRLKHSKNPTKSIGAAIANRRAKTMGISLHLLSPIDDIKTGDGQEIKTFVGFNAKTVLTTDPKKKGNIGETMRTNIKYESDLGVDLVHIDNGYAFSLEHYKQLKTPKERKQFMTIMTGALADHISRTEITSECVCTIKRGYMTEERCVTKETKLLPIVRKTPARG